MLERVSQDNLASSSSSSSSSSGADGGGSEVTGALYTLFAGLFASMPDVVAPQLEVILTACDAQFRKSQSPSCLHCIGVAAERYGNSADMDRMVTGFSNVLQVTTYVLVAVCYL
jgi:hypothetical protein